MPRPSVLPFVDWKKIFESSKPYEEWIAEGESEENRATIRRILAGLSLPPHITALLAALPRPVHVVAIAEDWCGDVVRHVPALQRLAQAAPNLKVGFIRRDQYPEVFARFLTNGGEAIPKFVFLSDRFVECGNWGPMPEECRKLIARGKACGDLGAARRKVGALYEADADQRFVIRELLELIDIASSPAP